MGSSMLFILFFFNDTATTEIYTLSLHDALPISADAGLGERHHHRLRERRAGVGLSARERAGRHVHGGVRRRSEEHTSELQSPCNLVCRLLLEKKKQQPALFHRPRVPRLLGDPPA